MKRQPLPFPHDSRTRVADRLSRWKQRWQNGGVEYYALDPEPRPFPLRARPRLARGWEYAQGIERSEHRIGIHGLPEAFRGFRVVQLTDIHHGLYLPLQALMDAVEMCNRTQPDMVALTGDFVTYSRAYVEPMAEVLSTLRARQGVFAVLGNHDFRVGAETITRALRRKGIEVLRNQNTTLRRGLDALHVAGIDDLGYRADLPRALRGVATGSPLLLLSHNPGIIRRAAAHGVHLVLSGHTHGGQVRLPLVGSIYGRAPHRQRFKSGLDALGGTKIYVSRGIGMVVVPLRYRCPAEIPLLTLEPARVSPREIH